MRCHGSPAELLEEVRKGFQRQLHLIQGSAVRQGSAMCAPGRKRGGALQGHVERPRGAGSGLHWVPGHGLPLGICVLEFWPHGSEDGRYLYEVELGVKSLSQEALFTVLGGS